MRILFLSRWFPFPADNGSKLRILNVLRLLSERHEVSLITFGERADVDNFAARRALADTCVSVRVLPYREFRPASARALVGLLSPRPRWLVDTHSDALQQAAQEELAKRACDLVIASQSAMLPYALALRGVPALLEELELSVFREAAGVRAGRPLVARAHASLTWLKLVAYLRRALPRFQACTVVSEAERRNVRRIAPNFASRVEVIPNAVDTRAYRGEFDAPRPASLVYSGALTYSANLDAVRYCVEDILPRVRAVIPDATLRITGRTDGVDLSGVLGQPGVELTGYVSDVRPVVAESWAAVVPLRLGGGTRLKILEAMALGTPVVSTRKGAEGLDAMGSEHLLLADEPGEFANQVVRLLRSPVLRSQLAASGKRLVETRYDWSVVGERLTDLVERLVTCKAA